MIAGIGSDLIDARRIQKLIHRYGVRLTHRLFTEQERQLAPPQEAKVSFFWAKRFAAKEACFKALGVGRGFGFFWHDVEVLRHSTGQPWMRCTGRIHAYLVQTHGAYAVHLALSDEAPFAQAFVVIERLGKA